MTSMALFNFQVEHPQQLSSSSQENLINPCKVDEDQGSQFHPQQEPSSSFPCNFGSELSEPEWNKDRIRQ